MPTLEAGSRFDNIAKSINAFCDNAIRVNLSMPLYFMGQGRVGTITSPWAEVDLIWLGPVDTTDIGPDGTHAVWTEIIININVFQIDDTPTGRANIYTLATVVDNIRQQFADTVSIPVYDYREVGVPQDGGLRIWTTPSMQRIDTPPDSGVSQYNISVPTRFVALTA